MSDISAETKSKILESAKTEFMEKGFTAASLRTIASNAGLTTGAMYRHFKDKDALFCALVDEPIEFITKNISAESIEMHKPGENFIGHVHHEDENRMVLAIVDYIYAHFDAFTLLVTKSAGSTHEKFVEEVSDMYTLVIKKIFESIRLQYPEAKPVDDMSLHILAVTMINSFVEVITHKLKLEEARAFMLNISDFFHFGFMHMLGMPCDNK